MTYQVFGGIVISLLVYVFTFVLLGDLIHTNCHQRGRERVVVVQYRPGVVSLASVADVMAMLEKSKIQAVSFPIRNHLDVDPLKFIVVEVPR